jgi:hypothetical protein
MIKLEVLLFLGGSLVQRILICLIGFLVDNILAILHLLVDG